MPTFETRPGLLTGDSVIVPVFDDAEVAYFRDALWKAGIREEHLAAAVEVLPALARFTPIEAADRLATVINTLGLGPEQYVGAAMVVRSLADRVPRITLPLTETSERRRPREALGEIVAMTAPGIGAAMRAAMDREVAEARARLTEETTDR